MKPTTAMQEIFTKPIEERSDREIELTKIFNQRESNRHLKSISNNLQFFFWLTVISFVLGILAFIINES